MAGHQGGNDADVGQVAGAEGEGVLLALEQRHGSFQLMVYRQVAAHQTGCAGTGAKPAQGLMGCRDQGWVFGKGQIVIGGEIDERSVIVSGKGKAPFFPADNGAQAAKPPLFPLLVQPFLQIDHSCFMSSANW